ncbi:fibronectin type III domain-containing protein [Candidatus Woesearchaeota archaeon]|nr:fibronectin type III domain-containing protein [Candidatus Woesearchaeota archaeon]
MKSKITPINKLLSILIISLLVNLTFVSALEISSVQSTDITETSATVSWNTDEPSDSFLHYGANKSSLQTIGDANPITSHQFTLEDLTPKTTYYYQVESNSKISDNNGSFYTFQTITPDTNPPPLQVSAPSSIAGTKVSLNGTTEPKTKLTLFVNNISKSTITAPHQEIKNNVSASLSHFIFPDIFLEPNKQNYLKIEALDTADNKAVWTGAIYSDNNLPILNLTALPTITDSNSFPINGTITKNSTYEIFVNNKSQAKGQGQKISHLINLQEGKNNIVITVQDTSGFVITKEFTMTADVQAPVVTFNLEKGNSYYQGRAESSISGKTKPNTKLYFFLYRQVGFQYTPKFDKAWAETTSDSKGEFTFKDINFDSEPFKQINPNFKLVPAGMEQISIFPLEQAEQQQQWTYYLFIVAEDQLGRKGFQQTTITINTCYSPNFDFQISSIPQFQAPLRLNPQLLDSGREVATAVFNFSYRGQGTPKIDLATGHVLESGYLIQGVQFERACTQGMLKDNSFKIGCNILPASLKTIPNGEKTSWYVTSNLAASQKLSETKEDFWNEFKKRQIMFPLKIRVDYQERDPNGNLGPMKSQTSCYDLGYFVDIPIDSKNMLPDFIADEGLKSIDFTIKQIETIQPYLETAIKIAGATCLSSIGVQTIVKWYRLFISNVESYYGAKDLTKKKEDRCPSIVEQQNLFLDSTIQKWQVLADKSNYFDNTNNPIIKYKIDPKNLKASSLNERCPLTANAWQIESGIDQLYRYSCDRFLCRKVPARWTASKTQEEVGAVASAQQQCAVTSLGIPLTKRENCQTLIQKGTNQNQIAVEVLKNGSFDCYQYQNKLYVIDSKQQNKESPLIKLNQVEQFGITLEALQEKFAGSGDLFAYQPEGSESFIVGQDRSCEAVCKNPKLPGYKADKDGGTTNNFKPEGASTPASGKYGCYREQLDASGKIIIQGKNGPIKSDEQKGPVRKSAGYTADCFLDLDSEGEPKGLDEASRTTGFLQCVCITDSKPTTKILGARTAQKEIDNLAEDWDYRESLKFRESKGVFGTYYPEWRYYNNRDFSSAFGQNSILDAFSDNKTYHEINPNTQHTGAFQTVCLTGINARLVTLRNILVGLSNCIKEAKYTGLQDVGVCKTIFSQHVCGLIYQSLAYFNNGCSTDNFQDELKGTTIEDIGVIAKSGFAAIPQAMQSSIKTVQSDYQNAKLNQYFAQGSQGVSQSICMAAFGYDWPIGMDFIMDTANSFSTKTDVIVVPAQRELSTYNPTAGTAVYNYKIGAILMPGCRIRSADVYLKCIGPEDMGHKGIECGPQGCDCLHATQKSAVEQEKTKFLDNGRKFNLKGGDFVDMKIPAPQRISSSYRYDHVVVDIKLDPYEKAETCFDEGYRDGKFYFPITDVSPEQQLSCQVEPLTGRFLCPEVLALFGGGGAYFEDPYLSCWDETTKAWSDCNTPNLFIKDRPIRVNNHLMTDGKKYCLKTTIAGLKDTFSQLTPRPLPELSGPLTIPLNLGTVTPSLFSGENSVRLSSESDPGCSNNILYENSPAGVQTKNKYPFSYELDSEGKYKITLPSGVTAMPPFQVTNQILTSNGNPFLTTGELSTVRFQFEGFTVYNLIGSPKLPQNNPKKACTYEIVPASSQVQGVKSITITNELLQPDASGDCFNAYIPVKSPAYGKNKHTQTITLQLEPFASKITSKFHSEFMLGNCGYVLGEAQQLINRRANDIADANALYYAIACYIMQGQYEWTTQYKQPICNYLNIFFNNKYVTGEIREPYPEKITNTAEYQKIYQYLAQINNKIKCEGITPISSTSLGTGKGTTCGSTHIVEDFIEPANWNKYVCREPDTSSICYDASDYSTKTIANQYNLQNGCPGTQKCCEPKAGTPSTSTLGKKCGDPSAKFIFTVPPSDYTDQNTPPAKWNQYTCQTPVLADKIAKDDSGKFQYNSFCFDSSQYQSKYQCPSGQLCCPPTEEIEQTIFIE